MATETGAPSLGPGLWVAIELIGAPANIGHFGKINDCDDLVVSMAACDIETRRMTGWTLVVPWAQVRFIAVSSATELDGFCKALAQARALQSAKTN